jgi:hypothetical protein
VGWAASFGLTLALTKVSRGRATMTGPRETLLSRPRHPLEVP